MSQCVAQDISGNIGIAFGIVTAAGLSTTLGAALAFVMPYSRDTKNLFLAACLSIAAGVMLYVSFVEILVKSISDFEQCTDGRFAYMYATLCFFGGLFLTFLFDRALHAFEAWAGKRKAKKLTSSPSTRNVSPTLPWTSQDIEGQKQSSSSSSSVHSASNRGQDEAIEFVHDIGHDGQLVASLYEQQQEKSAQALIRMGIFAGIALAFHNFPEGLATFVAVLEDPSVGVSVAIAIGIHNIPEGICVAMPIYYATGSRTKAFFWATLSGMTELIGAAVGWFVLRHVMTPAVYGVLFGIVAGMMVYISIKELIPTAHRYDADDKVTSIGLVFGMLIMAASLVLFNF